MELDQMAVHSLLGAVEKLDVQLSDERMRARDLEIQCHDERRLREIAERELDRECRENASLRQLLDRAHERLDELKVGALASPAAEQVCSPALPQAPVAWAAYDTFYVVDFIRRNSAFDADVIGQMLSFAQQAAQPAPVAQSEKEDAK